MKFHSTKQTYNVRYLFTIALIMLCFLLAGCGEGEAEVVPTSTPAPTAVLEETAPPYLDGSQPVEARVADLLQRMTLEEKVGQMTQAEKNSMPPDDVATYFIGSILSGGGGSPDDNTTAGWAEMTAEFQDKALSTRLGIPLIYGVDAVHGHNNLYGATIFPHQIGLGAGANPELVRQIGEATAKAILATGIHWNFAPVVAIPQDIRWGRTYEAYGEREPLVTELAVAYMAGLQTLPEGYEPAAGQTLYTLATPKHFLGDGGTVFGTSTEDNYLLDQGDMQLDEAAVRTLFLPPFQAAVDNGAMSIMPSYSSWNGVKMHAQRYWLTDVLRGELGFSGLVVSDWGAINQIDFDYPVSVVTAINAGVEMNMARFDYKVFINTMIQAVESGEISMDRIDEAVGRILTVKFALGLFDHPYGHPELAPVIGSDAHRALARQAVRESLVLLKNDNEALPIAKETPLIYVAGQGADDIGLQSGGWTITWQGTTGDITEGTTILEGIQAAVSPGTEVVYDLSGNFEGTADLAIVVVSEFPYAEGVGDRADLSLSQANMALISRVREQSEKLVVVILSGRPLIITDVFEEADAWVAAWLPGSEGDGVAEVLFGDYPFVGKLPFTWPRSTDQLPMQLDQIESGDITPLFPFGYGLETE